MAIDKKSDPIETIKQALQLQQSHRLPEAESLYRRVLTDEPEQPIALHFLGLLAHQSDKNEAAFDLISKAIAIKPDYAAAHSNLGHILRRLGRFDAAVDSCRKALSIDPNLAAAYNNLGAALKESGKSEEAVVSFQRALALRPDDDHAATNLRFELHHQCAWQTLDELGDAGGFTPFSHISLITDLSENLQVAREASRQISVRMSSLRQKFNFDRPQKSKLKIALGYLSSDFRNHAMAHLIARMLKLHDREDFDVLAFSHGPDDGSTYRQKIMDASDQFVDIRDLGNVEAAHKIYDSGVDILIDLNGHTSLNRLEICALSPAPIQMTYLGFPGSSGADFVDYILTYKVVTPEGHATFYSERIAYLPNSYFITDDTQKISKQPVTRKMCGLPEEGFVYCSFNKGFKIEPVMFDIWMSLLRDVPGSVLWLTKGNTAAEGNLRQEAQSRGVDPDRLIFADIVPKEQHLARHKLADLALDTRIFGGHTTTVDALWVGVPVVAHTGNHFASRVSTSILSAIEMPELASENLEDYRSLALKLSTNADELTAVRSKLSKNRTSKSLFNTQKTVRHFEDVYRQVWQRHLIDTGRGIV